MENIKKVLVVGTESVGKTSLLHYFIGEEEALISKTLGMEVFIQIDPNDDSRSIEYYELGGSASLFKEIASTYIQIEQFEGVIAIFDLNNTKSIDSISNILEFFNEATFGNNEWQMEEGHSLNKVPLLIIGNK